MTSTLLFEGIASISQLGIAIAVSFGVFVAWRQLGEWRKEKTSVRNSELAEEIIAVVSELSSKLDWIRSPFGLSPPEGEKDDKAYDFRRRLRELDELSADYLLLRRLIARQEALIGNSKVDEALHRFLEIRAKLFVALSEKIRSIARAEHRTEGLNEHEIERQLLRDSVIWAGGEEDEIGLALADAISIVSKEIIPIIRMERD